MSSVLSNHAAHHMKSPTPVHLAQRVGIRLECLKSILNNEHTQNLGSVPTDLLIHTRNADHGKRSDDDC